MNSALDKFRDFFQVDVEALASYALYAAVDVGSSLSLKDRWIGVHSECEYAKKFVCRRGRRAFKGNSYPGKGFRDIVNITKFPDWNALSGGIGGYSLAGLRTVIYEEGFDLLVDRRGRKDPAIPAHFKTTKATLPEALLTEDPGRVRTSLREACRHVLKDVRDSVRYQRGTRLRVEVTVPITPAPEPGDGPI